MEPDEDTKITRLPPYKPEQLDWQDWRYLLYGTLPGKEICQEIGCSGLDPVMCQQQPHYCSIMRKISDLQKLAENLRLTQQQVMADYSSYYITPPMTTLANTVDHDIINLLKEGKL